MSEKKTRRRGAMLERAILDAAWIELTQVGWSGFTIEGVAERSGAAKSVIYRRWRNRTDLVQGMLNEAAASQPELGSSGDLRTDLIALMTDVCHFLRGPFGQAIRGATGSDDPGASPSVFSDHVVIARLQSRVDEAVGRGDLPAAPDPLAVNVGHAMVLWEFLATGSPPPADGVERLVDSVWLPALRHSGRSGSPSVGGTSYGSHHPPTPAT